MALASVEDWLLFTAPSIGIPNCLPRAVASTSSAITVGTLLLAFGFSCCAVPFWAVCLSEVFASAFGSCFFSSFLGVGAGALGASSFLAVAAGAATWGALAFSSFLFSTLVSTLVDYLAAIFAASAAAFLAAFFLDDILIMFLSVNK